MIASYLFYAAWSPPFVLLLMSSAVIDFVLAHLIGNSQSPTLRKLLLVLSLSINLGLLGIFKYGGFLLENVNAVLGFFDFRYPVPLPSLVLPLGISFYTFETTSVLDRRLSQPHQTLPIIPRLRVILDVLPTFGGRPDRAGSRLPAAV